MKRPQGKRAVVAARVRYPPGRLARPRPDAAAGAPRRPRSRLSTPMQVLVGPPPRSVHSGGMGHLLVLGRRGPPGPWRSDPGQRLVEVFQQVVDVLDAQ